MRSPLRTQSLQGGGQAAVDLQLTSRIGLSLEAAGAREACVARKLFEPFERVRQPGF